MFIIDHEVLLLKTLIHKPGEVSKYFRRDCYKSLTLACLSFDRRVCYYFNKKRTKGKKAPEEEWEGEIRAVTLNYNSRNKMKYIFPSYCDGTCFQNIFLNLLGSQSFIKLESIYYVEKTANILFHPSPSFSWLNTIA